MDTIANLSGDFNLSDVNTSKQFVSEEITNISGVSHILNVIISLLTLVFNGIIIKCLLHHRSKFPEVIFQQTLCLSVTDFVAGLSPATSCILLIKDFDRSFRTCVAVVAVCNASQFAVMINLCFLSVRRWIVLRNVSKPRANAQNTTTKRLVLYLLMPWVITALGMIPIIRIIILQGSAQTNGCLSINTFRENGYALTYSAFNIILLVLLTAFYIFSIFALKRTTRQTANDFRSRNKHLQEKAFKNLVAVLVVANVTTLPLVVNIFLSFMNIVRNGQLLYLSSQMQVATTVINPIVYSFQITELRNTIKGSLKENCEHLFCCRCQVPRELYAEQTVGSSVTVTNRSNGI